MRKKYCLFIPAIIVVCVIVFIVVDSVGSEDNNENGINNSDVITDYAAPLLPAIRGPLIIKGKYLSAFSYPESNPQFFAFEVYVDEVWLGNEKEGNTISVIAERTLSDAKKTDEHYDETIDFGGEYAVNIQLVSGDEIILFLKEADVEGVDEEKKFYMQTDLGLYVDDSRHSWSSVFLFPSLEILENAKSEGMNIFDCFLYGYKRPSENIEYIRKYILENQSLIENRN